MKVGQKTQHQFIHLSTWKTKMPIYDLVTERWEWEELSDSFLADTGTWSLYFTGKNKSISKCKYYMKEELRFEWLQTWPRKKSRSSSLKCWNSGLVSKASPIKTKQGLEPSCGADFRPPPNESIDLNFSTPSSIMSYTWWSNILPITKLLGRFLEWDPNWAVTASRYSSTPDIVHHRHKYKHKQTGNHLEISKTVNDFEEVSWS